MAPVYIALGAWETAELPGAAIFSLVTLFIITITLLALCSRCQKHSFDLDHNLPEDRNSSLVRVVQLETTNTSMENPSAADITTDEKYLSTFRLDEAVKSAALQAPGTWRSHTLDRNPQRMTNGGDRNDLITHNLNLNLNPNPTVSEPPVAETSLQSMDQTVSTHTENILSANTPELHGFQTISLDDQTDQIHRDSPPPSYTKHMYETAEEIKHSEASGIADQRESMLNPYATYETIMTNDMNTSRGDGSYTPAPPVLGGGPSSPVIDTYARVSRKTIRNSNPPDEPSLQDEAEEGVPPLPQRS